MDMEIAKTLIQYGALGIIAFYYIRDNSKTRKAELENNKTIMEFITKTLVGEISTAKSAVNTNIAISNKIIEQNNNNCNIITQRLIELEGLVETINCDNEQLQKVKDIVSDAIEEANK